MLGVKNLLWICIDSLRRDYVSTYTDDLDLTPVIDSVAVDGCAFTNCHSSGIKTPAASTSILTGTHPMYHGVNGDPDDESAKILDDSVETVAERLRSVGYNTGAVSRNVHVSEFTEKHRGFDDFTWLEQNPFKAACQLPPSEAVRFLAGLPRHASTVSINGAMHSPVPAVTRRVRSLLEEYEASTDPYFLYAHYNEVHRPYIPPRKEMAQHLPDGWSRRHAAKTSLGYHEELYDIMVNGRQDEIDDELLEALYKAEIQHIDTHLGKIFESVDLDETVVVITADHGEYLGEYGLYGHQLLPRDEVTKVPLIISGLDERVDTDQLCQHIDVLATFFEESNILFEQLQGIDLREESRQYALTEYHSGLSVFRQYCEDLDALDLYSGHVQSLRSNEFRYIEDTDDTDLYKPGDGTPLEDTERTNDFRNVLSDYRTTFERQTAKDDGQANESIESHLADLGYLG